MEYLHYYKEAKKQGWKPDVYSLEIKFNPSIILNFDNLTLKKLVQILKKYFDYNITFEAHIKKNSQDIDLNEYQELGLLAMENRIEEVNE